MGRNLKLPEDAQRLWRCPVCGSALALADASVVCVNESCGTSFPIVDGAPILLNESNSVFSIDDIRDSGQAAELPLSALQRAVRRRLPSPTRNSVAARNYERFGRLLLEMRSSPRVLVVGGSTIGHGMEAILSTSTIEVVETDIAFGQRTQLVCDAHDLPFIDKSFDGVIIQAVLEHVVDPFRCVDEIHRVLKDDGLVYAETPFMQQVHLGPYDFTRFTHLGHRRLFRRFDEVDSGLVAGPGTVLSWSYEHFLLSFVRGRAPRGLVKAFSRLTGFWLKYLDTFVNGRPGALDAASGYYFMGRKSDHALPDRELIKLYRGAHVT